MIGPTEKQQRCLKFIKKFINEPVDPDKKMWYTGNNIRNFLREF